MITKNATRYPRDSFLVPVYNRNGKSEQRVRLRHCHRSGRKISVGLSAFKLRSHQMQCIALRCVAVWRRAPLHCEENMNVCRWLKLGLVTSAEEGGYVFSSVSLPVCPSDYSQTCERILTKFFGEVGHGSRTK